MTDIAAPDREFVLRTEYVSLDELLTRRHPENPKTHDLDGLISSYRRFGFVDPVVEDGRTGTVMAGHGRLDALEAMRRPDPNGPHPAGIMRDHGVWKVPVTVGWASRDDAEAKALLIGLNRHTEAGGWDDRALVTLLGELGKEPDGLYGTGFSLEQAAALAMITRAPDHIVPFDPMDEWRGMPGFQQTDHEPVLTITFIDADERDRFLREVLGDGYPITRKKTPTIWHTYWPPRPMNDLASVKFQPEEDEAEASA